MHLQVFLGQSGVCDVQGNELPRLVYVSREKRPGFDHHKKAGAMNALVCIKLKSSWPGRKLFILFVLCAHLITILLPLNLTLLIIFFEGSGLGSSVKCSLSS